MARTSSTREEWLTLVERHGVDLAAVGPLRLDPMFGRGVAHISVRSPSADELQDRGFDTVDANLELGFPVDGRGYGVGAQILA